MKDGRLHEKTEKRNRKKLKTSQNILKKRVQIKFYERRELYIKKK